MIIFTWSTSVCQLSVPRKKAFSEQDLRNDRNFGLSVSDSETIKLKFLKTLDNEMTCISICVNVLT